MTQSSANPSRSTIFTRIQDKIHIQGPEFIWLALGVLALVLLFLALANEKKKSPALSQSPKSDLHLTPSEAGFFLMGYKYPASIILATLLDFARRGIIRLEDLGGDPSIHFLGQPGPLQDHETYLLEKLGDMAKGEDLTLSQIRRRRINFTDDFNGKVNHWFELIDGGLHDRGLKDAAIKHRENATATLCFGGALLFISALGLASGHYYAFMILVAGLGFFVLAARIYGRLPEKGQAALAYLQVLEKESNQDLYYRLDDLDPDTVFLFGLAINRPLDDLVSSSSPLSQDMDQAGQEDYKRLLDKVKDAFVGKAGF